MLSKTLLSLSILIFVSGCATLNREVTSISREEVIGTGQKYFRSKTYNKTPMEIKNTFGEPFSVGYRGEGDRIYYMAYPIGSHSMKVSTIMLSNDIYCYFFEFYAEDGYVLKEGHSGDNHMGQFCAQLKTGEYRYNDSKIKSATEK